MASHLMARSFAYDPRRFQWLSRVHVGAIVGLVIAAIIILRTSPIYFATAVILLIGALSVVVSLLITAVPPMITKHRVTGDAVILKQGAFFEYRVPFTNIRSIAQTDEVPFKPGIKALRGDSTLYVLANLKGAVALRLNESQRYKGMSIDKVVADLDTPEEFITCVKERMEGERILAKLDAKIKKKKGALKNYQRDPLIPPPKFKKPVIGAADIPDADEDAGEEPEEAGVDPGEELGDIGEDESEDGDEGDNEGQRDAEGPSARKRPTKDERTERPRHDDDGLTTPTRIPPTKPRAVPKMGPKTGPAPEKDMEEYVAVPAWGGGAGAEDRPRIVRIPKRKNK